MIHVKIMFWLAKSRAFVKLISARPDCFRFWHWTFVLFWENIVWHFLMKLCLRVDKLFSCAPGTPPKLSQNLPWSIQTIPKPTPNRPRIDRAPTPDRSWPCVSSPDVTLVYRIHINRLWFRWFINSIIYA